MLRFFGKISAARGRFLLYALAFPGAFALDIVTTLAIADWLIELILVWIASVWGDLREIYLVAAVASITVLAGLWSSPPDISPWKGILNRLAAIILMWAIVWVANRKRVAEASQREEVPRATALPDLLPVCASCKAIREESGQWRTMERHFSATAGVAFTHGLCPQCAAKYREQM